MSQPFIIKDIEGDNSNFLGAIDAPVQIEKTGFFLCTEGQIECTIGGVRHLLSKNSIIVCFPYTILQVTYRSHDLRGVLMGVDLESLQPVLNRITDFDRLFLIQQSPCLELTDQQRDTMLDYIRLLKLCMVHIIEDEQSHDERRLVLHNMQRDKIRESLMVEILLLYNGNSDMTALGVVNRKDVVLQNFFAALYHNYREQHEVSYYADKQYLSTRYFSNIIKERSGKNPSQWIAQTLLNEAKHLLTDTDMTVKEISDHLNFPNQSYFGKWFKNQTNMSPLEYKSA